MKYKEMIEEAKMKGLTSEKIMSERIQEVEDLLCISLNQHMPFGLQMKIGMEAIRYGNTCV